MTLWANDIFQVLVNHQVRQVAYVPDAGHTHLINRCGQYGEMVSVPLTTEEEGIALLAGAWLGGDRGAEAKIVAREYKGSFQFNERVS